MHKQSFKVKNINANRYNQNVKCFDKINTFL